MAEKKPARQSLMDALDGGTIADSVYQGVTLGFGDEIDAALNASVRAPFSGEDWDAIYDRTLQDGRAHNKRFQTDHSVQDIIGRGIGAVMLPLGGGKMVIRGASVPEKLGSYARGVGKGIPQGMALGAVSGAGQGEGEDKRAELAGRGALVGALMRAVIPGGGPAQRFTRRTVTTQGGKVYDESKEKEKAR